ncbi:DUF2972 domain-containing protein [Campylobacter upsaliensis]|uniref:DUF2972 domain-containing protein n=1 Tax=Campylobacter upsaliensis TaxID=28080 RepID=UPI002B3C1A4E|nr:DUF2972 domain-containing protein [Campylobacter upsaliensis]MEB2795590.1 DUF2972 domain-containing protein [Campylobacter upsaliensis]
MRGNFKEFICRKKKQMGRNLFLYFGWLYSKLPQNYKFIFISFGVSGNAALITFLSLCGLREIRLAQDNEVEYYKESKKKLKDSIGENYISIFFYNNKKRFNVARILSYKAPILIVLRDPISRFRSMMNYRFLLLNNKVLDLNLKNDLRTTLSEILYGDEARLTKKSQLTYVENLLLNGNFKFKSDLTPFLTNEGGGGGNPRQVIYIDMEEIKADKAFDTMKRLSQILHFNPPKEEDRVKFERKVADIYFSVPNFTIFVDDKDFPQLKEKIKIVVAKEQEKMANLTNAKNLFLNENDLCYQHLSINVEQKHYELIKEDKEIKEKLKNYFKEFVKVLDEKVRFRKQHALNENDVLEYFKNNKTLALQFKALLDKELIHIKQTRPDIIASWKYYEEFEKICEGLKN